jgi:putative transposase
MRFSETTLLSSLLTSYPQNMKPVRRIAPPGTYFITFSTWQRRRLFVIESYIRLFLKTLYGYRRQSKFLLHAFVVMPEHVHLLLTPAKDVTLERAVQLIKGGYSHAFGLECRGGEVWQRGFTDHRIRDDVDFENHRTYIHQNPVKRGLVNDPVEYRYCSAYPGFRLDERTPAAEAPSFAMLARHE